MMRYLSLLVLVLVGISLALGQGRIVTDPDIILPPASIPPQPAGVPFTDPTFDTVLRRVTNASQFSTHIYSQLQAFSSDNEYVLLIENDAYTVRHVTNLNPVSGLDS